MRVDVLTIFPQVFPGPLGIGVVGRAIESGDLTVNAVDLRGFTTDKHRHVDDVAFGGGPGMVLKAEPLTTAIRQFRAQSPRVRCILMSPQGRRFDQTVAKELAQEEHLLLICGRYQGVDQRARDEIGEELSVGDYILSGGEVAAMAVIEATARLLPGVVGSALSLEGETFSGTRLEGFEAPLYTRPANFEGKEVPAVLREGNPKAIERWRLEQRNQIQIQKEATPKGGGTR